MALGNTEQRNPYYDILKGIGIISIVIGHCFPVPDIIRFVYGYHLAIFFFVSGLQYQDQKYALKPFLLIQNRMRSMWPPLFFYLTFFTLTHDLFLRYHLLPAGEEYDLLSIFLRLFNNFFFLGGETLGGAMWFVPMMLVGLALFTALVFFSTRYFYRFRVFVISAGALVLGLIGMELNVRGCELLLHSHTAFLLIPVFLVGYLLTLYKADLNRVFIWPVAILAFAVFAWLVMGKDLGIELSQEKLVSRKLFYLITFSGIYSVCYLAKLMSRWKISSKVLSFLGRYSFDIMALHFLCFKVVDGLWGRFLGDAPEIYSAFPCAYPTLWPVYLILSLAAIPWIRIFIQKIHNKLLSLSSKWFGSP